MTGAPGQREGVYPSKVDWWLWLILIGAALLTVGSGISLLLTGKTWEMVMGIGMLCMSLWMVWVPRSTYYKIIPMEKEELFITCGGISSYHIPLDSIIEVFPTNNPLSSPACSIDRLEIKYRSRSLPLLYGESHITMVLISPLDKDSFLQHLVEATPALERVGLVGEYRLARLELMHDEE